MVDLMMEVKVKGLGVERGIRWVGKWEEFVDCFKNRVKEVIIGWINWSI